MQIKLPLPNQTIDIYSLLLNKGALSAEQIGRELSIYQHSVYRAIKQLKSIGCVEQVGKRPAFFQAQPVNESVETFALLQREWFLKAFLQSQKNKEGFPSGELQMSFIENREDWFEKMVSDLAVVKQEIDLLTSGDEAPAENVLAQKKFMERGGLIRRLVQKRNLQNEPFLQAHKRMGEQVKVIDPIQARLMVFDRRIVYFMSYDPLNYIKSVGIRIEYAPLGQLMYGLFMQYWEKGKEL